MEPLFSPFSRQYVSILILTLSRFKSLFTRETFGVRYFHFLRVRVTLLLPKFLLLYHHVIRSYKPFSPYSENGKGPRLKVL